MARGSAPLDGSVLPPSRIVSERQAGLPRRFMPESATGREVVELGEGRPAPHYPGRSVFFLSFAMAGLVPPFSSFFMDILEFYDLQMAHLTPNAIMTLAIFAHLCEMFIGVRPSLRLFQWFFTVQPVSPPTVVGGCYFQPRGQVLHRYIPCVLRKKWDDWKSDWLDAARGVLDAAAARERRAAENEAASRQREEALEARAMALEERARAKERDLADREAAVAIREATLAAHEAACAEEESALRLREDALAERERALEEAEAAAQRLADSLFLRKAAREEQARRNLEGARAERAALDQRAAELEARAKELDARAHSGGAAAGDGDLAARLAAAEHTIAELQGAGLVRRGGRGPLLGERSRARHTSGRRLPSRPRRAAGGPLGRAAREVRRQPGGPRLAPLRDDRGPRAASRGARGDDQVILEGPRPGGGGARIGKLPGQGP
jgi:hypothetical protein